MAEIQNDQPIDLSEFLRETHVCLKNNDYDWRAETKQKHQEILSTLSSNMWGREEREEWSKPRGWTCAPVDVWREGCSPDQDHDDDDDDDDGDDDDDDDVEVEEEDDGGGGG